MYLLERNLNIPSKLKNTRFENMTSHGHIIWMSWLEIRLTLTLAAL